MITHINHPYFSQIIMFSSFIEEIQYRKKYYTSLCNYIENHIEDGRPMVAVHGFCTDGGTAGAIIHQQSPESLIIPLDYSFLNHPKANDILASLNWHGIVDLSPFNKHTVSYWVDHHRSAINKVVNAKRIRFDENGDSGAYQLFLSGFLGLIPNRLVELAVMTRTTDTAGYITEPPTNQYSQLSDLKIAVTEGIEGRKQNEQRIWLLDDAWGSVTTLKEQLVMYDKLAKKGFMGIEHALPRINDLRGARKKAYDQADDIEMHELIIYSFEAGTIDDFTITRKLQSNGAKVVISMAVEPNGVKLSFRRNRSLTDKDKERIQLHQLAERMGGGGHAGASGAYAKDVETALRHINNWNQSVGLDLHRCEL